MSNLDDLIDKHAHSSVEAFDVLIDSLPEATVETMKSWSLQEKPRKKKPLKVSSGGNITGHLPCGHDVKWIDVFVGEVTRTPYCTKCWNK